MSVRVMAQVFDSRLAPRERLVMLYLGSCANDEGEHVYPTVATICRRTGYEERAVRRALAELREAGVLEAVDETPGKKVVYRICIPKLVGFGLPTSPQSDRGTPPQTDTPPQSDRGVSKAGGTPPQTDRGGTPQTDTPPLPKRTDPHIKDLNVRETSVGNVPKPSQRAAGQKPWWEASGDPLVVRAMKEILSVRHWGVLSIDDLPSPEMLERTFRLAREAGASEDQLASELDKFGAHYRRSGGSSTSPIAQLGDWFERRHERWIRERTARDRQRSSQRIGETMEAKYSGPAAEESGTVDVVRTMIRQGVEAHVTFTVARGLSPAEEEIAILASPRAKAREREGWTFKRRAA